MEDFLGNLGIVIFGGGIYCLWKTKEYFNQMVELSSAQCISVNQLNDFIESGDQKQKLFVEGRVCIDNERLLSRDSSREGVLIDLKLPHIERSTVDSFRLKASGNPRGLFVQNFSQTKVVDTILQKYIYWEKSRGVKQQIVEEILVEGSFLCLFGQIIRQDEFQNAFSVQQPEYFAKSKEDIVNYMALKSIKFGSLGVGGIICGWLLMSNKK